ncbi:uncharacterized protein C10orf67, mitochondrial-like [Physella acuta]|uniref:uncharacterized protein C10orf67, mitochondrial-like n=1 Tax=Physella acuta TaxID=109671 RepID=UPI0027DD2B02|nr:uncharacterized protein C10orf67, mitochondrial-like [Physella acuta]
MADTTSNKSSSKINEVTVFNQDQDYNYYEVEKHLQERVLAVTAVEKNDEMFRPSLSDNTKIGFFSLDRSSQTEVSEMIDLKDMTKVLQTLLQDASNLRRDINFSKHVIQADHESKLQEKSLELYCRINEKVTELEKMHQDRVNALRKAFRQQLADAIARLSLHFSKNLQTKINKEKSKQENSLASKEEKFREMQATILRNEGIIQMLKAQLQQQQMKDEDEDERFLNRELSEEASPQPDLQDEINALQEELEESKKNLEKSEKNISRLEETLEIKEKEILRLEKDLSTLKEQFERSSILIQQMKQEQMEMADEAAREKENSKKLLGNQKDEMKRMMDEQIRLAKEEALKKLNEEAQKMTGDQAKIKQLQIQVATLESQLAKEKEKVTILTNNASKSETQKDSESKLRAEIIRLQSELEKTHQMWEKKFAILQQSMHALKDESYLRQTLQRQAAQLHKAAVSYSVDKPSGVAPIKEYPSSPKAPLPEIGRRGSRGGNQAQDRDYISYTVSAPSGRGTDMFSPDENQIMFDNEIEMIPSDVMLLPEPPQKNRKDFNVESRPSSQSKAMNISTIAVK